MYMDNTNQINWILLVTFISIAIPGEIGILVSFIHYGQKTKTWKERNQRYVEKLSSRNLNAALVACETLCVIFSLLSLVYISVGFKLDKNGSLCFFFASVLCCLNK